MAGLAKVVEGLEAIYKSVIRPDAVEGCQKVHSKQD